MFKVLRNALSVLRRLLNKTYYYWAILSARIAGGKLFISSNVSFAVPVRVNGQGDVTIGWRTSLGFRLAPSFGFGGIILQAREQNSAVVIGEKCGFSNNVVIIARSKIELGSHCLVGDRVTIMDADFHVIDPDLRLKEGGPGETIPVLIGDNCWIGTGALILKGVTIGDGSIIAPKSVVTKSFPARSVIAGNPACLIRTFSP